MSSDISTAEFWRKHFDKVAVTRVQTPHALAVRRESLIAAVSSYLQCLAVDAKPSQPLAKPKSSKSRIQSTASNLTRARGHLKNTWKCDDAWLKTLDGLNAQFERPPTKYELSKFLGFPAPVITHSDRPNRKKAHAV